MLLKCVLAVTTTFLLLASVSCTAILRGTGQAQGDSRSSSQNPSKNLALIEAVLHGELGDIEALLKNRSEPGFIEHVVEVAVVEAARWGKTKVLQAICRRLQVSGRITRIALGFALRYGHDAAAMFLLEGPLELSQASFNELVAIISEYGSLQNAKAFLNNTTSNLKTDAKAILLEVIIKHGDPEYARKFVDSNREFSQNTRARIHKLFLKSRREKSDDATHSRYDGSIYEDAILKDQARCEGGYYFPEKPPKMYVSRKEAMHHQFHTFCFDGELGAVLEEAAFEGNTELLEYFLFEANPPFEFPHDGKYMTLVNAAARGHVKTVELLVKHGVEVNHLNDALAATNRNTHPELFVYLVNAFEAKQYTS